MRNLKARLIETNPERAEAFEKAASAHVKRILTHFKDFDFYCGEEAVGWVEGKCMLLPLNWRGHDGELAYFTVWKDGVIAVKH